MLSASCSDPALLLLKSRTLHLPIRLCCFYVCRNHAGLPSRTREFNRESSSVDDSLPRAGKKRRATGTWCPWSNDSDDDDRTTSNSMPGSTYSTVLTAADTTRKRLVAGKAAVMFTIYIVSQKRANCFCSVSVNYEPIPIKIGK